MLGKIARFEVWSQLLRCGGKQLEMRLSSGWIALFCFFPSWSRFSSDSFFYSLVKMRAFTVSLFASSAAAAVTSNYWIPKFENLVAFGDRYVILLRVLE